MESDIIDIGTYNITTRKTMPIKPDAMIFQGLFKVIRHLIGYGLFHTIFLLHHSEL